ncbi:TonB-dependent receptor [Aurantivibrio plasticivorans]
MNAPKIVGTLLSLSTLLSINVSAQDNQEIDEVIVTANKREQSLQDVAVAVSVIGGEAVQKAQMDNGTDIARLAPNVNVSYFGLPDQPKFALRGAATTDFALNTSSATGIVVDEVNLAASYFGGPLMFDVERIEALRGPQGTLFGKNTTGGAIHFITRVPSFDRGGYIAGSTGNYGYQHINGALETPLIENKLATRLAFTYSKSDGFWKNNYPGGKDLGNIDNYAARLSFAYQGGSWDSVLRLFSSRSTPKAAGIISEGFLPGGVNVNGINPREGHANCAAESYDSWQGCWDRSGDIEVETDGAYLTLNKDLDNFTFTSITSLIKGSFYNTVDADGTADVASLLHIDFYAESDEIQQEFRLTSNFGGNFDFITGVFYFDEQSYVPTVTRLGGGTVNIATEYNQRRESIAAYFNGRYRMTDSLALNLGARWTRDNGDFTDFSSMLNDTTVFVPEDPANDMDYRDSAPTGDIALEYTTVGDSLIYGKLSRGYRSSTFDGSALTSANSLSTADPEYINSFELGYKTQLAGNRIRLNSALFFSDYNDMQLLNATGPNESEIINIDAEMYGLEVELTALISESLLFTAGLGYLQGEYTNGIANDSAAGFAAVDISENDLIEAPDFNVSLAFDYDIPVGNDLIEFHIDTNYVDDQFFDVFNNDYVATDSYWQANARISWTLQSSFSLALWGKNLTENDEYVGRIRTTSLASTFGVAPQPRRFGVEARYEF